MKPTSTNDFKGILMLNATNFARNKKTSPFFKVDVTYSICIRYKIVLIFIGHYNLK